MTRIDQLNRRLGEDLGFATGDSPRFAWKYAPDVAYFYRSQGSQHYERFTWADRIGKRWMLCQWRKPEWLDHDGNIKPITPADWQASFGGELPYPDRMYGGHPETALGTDEAPTMELTVAYIASMRRQMSLGEEGHLREILAGLEQDRLDTEKEFMACADDSFPAFWKNGQGHEAGKRGAHVSFGGA